MIRTSIAPFALALLGSTASADTPAPGYELELLPGGGSYLTAALSSGEFVGLSGASVALFAEDGSLLQVLHDYGPFNVSAPNGIAIDPSETVAVVCRDDGSIRDTYRIDLTSGAAT